MVTADLGVEERNLKKIPVVEYQIPKRIFTELNWYTLIYETSELPQIPHETPWTRVHIAIFL
jgi:hypothetical protein